jgi:hypothetical protein
MVRGGSLDGSRYVLNHVFPTESRERTKVTIKRERPAVSVLFKPDERQAHQRPSAPHDRRHGRAVLQRQDAARLHPAR